MRRYRVVGALVACAAVAAVLALIGGAFGNGSAQAARGIQADKAAPTLTIEGLEGASALEVQSYSWGVKNRSRTERAAVAPARAKRRSAS